MAKKSSIEKNNRRAKMVAKFAPRRAELKAVIMNKATSPAERFAAVMKLSKLPKNSAKERVRNRCLLSGRSRGFYRKFGLSRIWLRTLASSGELPGVTKASW